MEPIDPGVASIALDAMDPNSFESFGQIALAQILGVQFEPSGGLQDGGQDGFLRARRGKPTSYVQISKERDVRGKIRRTLRRLEESGRSVDVLTYLTSEGFPTRDQFEVEVEKETGVQLRIHDRSWIMLQIARDDTVRENFSSRSSHAIRSAMTVASSSIQSHTLSERMSVLVYMDAHARSAPQETDLLTLAVDAAIYKALEGTDPDRGIFKTESEVSSYVEKQFPAVKKRPSLSIPNRLDRLSAKKNNPRIRKYTKEDKYCLPYDVRNELSQENEALRRLEIEFYESLRERGRALGVEDVNQLDDVVKAAFSAVTKTFERQGMNLAASFEAVQTYEEVRTYEFVREALSGRQGDNSEVNDLADIAAKIISQVFYSGSELERSYLIKLFKLYSTEFVLNGDERVASYFKSISSQLRLVVGSDVIIRAMSEVCLRPEAQSTQNMLAYLRKSGAQIFITEPILQEVYTHIIAEGKEFEAHYLPWINHATIDQVKNSDRILIRAFFYSYFEPDRHARSYRDWRSFLANLGQAEWFDKREYIEEFAAFLLKKFDLDFIHLAEVKDGVSLSDINRLKSAILARRQVAEILAENDAMAALYVNRQRQVRNEKFGTSVYGYRTWWLTEEFHIVQAAQSQNIDARFSMHPQFLMNFCMASPAMRELTDGFGVFFPTNFGLRITERMSEATLREFLKAANRAASEDSAVASSRIRAFANKLQGYSY